MNKHDKNINNELYFNLVCLQTISSINYDQLSDMSKPILRRSHEHNPVSGHSTFFMQVIRRVKN